MKGYKGYLVSFYFMTVKLWLIKVRGGMYNCERQSHRVWWRDRASSLYQYVYWRDFTERRIDTLNWEHCLCCSEAVCKVLVMCILRNVLKLSIIFSYKHVLFRRFGIPAHGEAYKPSGRVSRALPEVPRSRTSGVIQDGSLLQGEVSSFHQ